MTEEARPTQQRTNAYTADAYQVALEAEAIADRADREQAEAIADEVDRADQAKRADWAGRIECEDIANRASAAASAAAAATVEVAPLATANAATVSAPLRSTPVTSAGSAPLDHTHQSQNSISAARTAAHAAARAAADAAAAARGKHTRFQSPIAPAHIDSTPQQELLQHQELQQMHRQRPERQQCLDEEEEDERDWPTPAAAAKVSSYRFRLMCPAPLRLPPQLQPKVPLPKTKQMAPSGDHHSHDPSPELPFNPGRPKCALCGVNFTSEHHEQRSIHEQGDRHRDNMAAVLHAMQRESCVAAALAGMVRRRIPAQIACHGTSVRIQHSSSRFLKCGDLARLTGIESLCTLSLNLCVTALKCDNIVRRVIGSPRL